MEVTEIPRKGEEAVPVAVKNYRTDLGWQQATITSIEDPMIQREVRRRNNETVAEALRDARVLLAEAGVRDAVAAQRVADLALFLAERRIIHVSRIYDEYLTAKINRERSSRTHEEAMEEEAEAQASASYPFT